MIQLNEEKGRCAGRARDRGRQHRRGRGPDQRRPEAVRHRDRAAGARGLPRRRGRRPRGVGRGAGRRLLRAPAEPPGPPRSRQPVGRGAQPAAAGDRRPHRARGGRPLPGPGADPDADRAGGPRPPDGRRGRGRRGLARAGRRGRRRRPPRDDPRAARAAAKRRPAAGGRRPLRLRADPGAGGPGGTAGRRRGGAPAACHRPRCSATSARSPTSPSRGAAPASSPGSRRSGWRPPPPTLPPSTGLPLEHARLWLAHVGLGRPLEQIDGDPQTALQARRAIEEGASPLLDELRTSLDFYGAQEGAVPIEKVVLCGPGSARSRAWPSTCRK